MKTLRYKIILLAIAILGMAWLNGHGQFPEWTVPEKEAALQNPVPLSPKVLAGARAFYDIQCKSCHGPRALGDGVIPAANLTTDEFLAQTDGAIFWKLMQGRDQMPSFAAIPADQLWEVIHYLRSLARPVERIARKKTLVTLSLVEQDTLRRVVARAYEVLNDGAKVPLSDVKLILGVKRFFGVLPLTASFTYTNSEGRVSALFPDHLPADTAGFVVITASVDDPGYEPGTVEEKVAWGTAWTFADITKQRSLWAQLRYAPIWLLISFTGVAAAIWLTILYVMLELKKINDKGRKHAASQPAPR